MMGCLLHSLQTLIWALVLLALIIYLFTVIFLEGSTSFIRGYSSRGHTLRSGVDVNSYVIEHFGDFGAAFRSLFMAVTGGTDWYDMQASLAYVGSTYGVLFLFYVFFMMFVLFNVLVGVFVDKAFEASKLDTYIAIHTEKDRLRSFMSEVNEMFEELDKDDNGVITLDQFVDCQNDARMMTFLQAHHLNIIDPALLFSMMDRDNSGEVDLDEITMGMMRLGGQARSSDLMLLLGESRKFQQELLSTIRSRDESGSK